MKNVAAILLFVVVLSFFLPWATGFGVGVSLFEALYQGAYFAKEPIIVYSVCMLIALVAAILALCNVNAYRWIAIPLSFLIFLFTIVMIAMAVEERFNIGIGLILTALSSLAVFVVSIVEGVQSRRARIIKRASQLR